MSYLDNKSLVLNKEIPFDNGYVVDPVLLGPRSSQNMSFIESVNLFRKVFDIVACRQRMGERFKLLLWKGGVGRGEESG